MASNRKPTTKKAPAPKAINVKIHVGGRKLTKAQIARLKAYVGNQVLTWISDDVRESPIPIITCSEIGLHPPGPGPRGGEGDSGDNG